MSEPFWTDLVKRLSPYVPGEQRHGRSVTKLNTNENPYPPSPKVMKAIAETDGHALRRYPDPESVELREALAKHHGLNTNEVFVGNGSDEVLALAFMAFFTGDNPLQFPEISYSFYPVYCDLLNIEQKRLPMGDGFTMDIDSFEDNRGGIIFPNPNAPTTLAVSLDAIAKLLKRVPNTLVLIDEAYVDFGAQSAIKLINDYPNLVVTHTFSKSRSLAGLRLGAAFANDRLIEALLRVKNSFNSYPIDAIAQRAAVASIRDNEYYENTLQKIITTRTNSINKLQQRGYTVLPSAANFVFASPPDGDAAKMFALLNDHEVLVRFWPKGELSSWLRISIGTDEEMEKLFSVIDKASPN